MNGTHRRHAGGAQETRHLWRILGWGGAAALIAAPLVAMRFTRAVNWDAADFLFAAALFAVAGGLLELAVRLSPSRAYRAGFAVAVLGGLLTIWINLAVGIVGAEDDPFNLWFFAVPAVGAFGALAARFRARGMALTMVAVAAVQAAIFVVASVRGAGFVLPATILFGGLWLAAGWLFARAAREG